jgi:ferredoxin like protein
MVSSGSANTTLEEKMRTVRFNVDDRPHIVVHTAVCQDCAVRACVYVCPANLFVPLNDGGILFNYEECFECGTCYVACNQEGAIEWSYPRGGFGVTFRES